MTERSEIDELLKKVSTFISTEIVRHDQDKLRKREAIRPTVIVTNGKLCLSERDMTRPKVSVIVGDNFENQRKG